MKQRLMISFGAALVALPMVAWTSPLVETSVMVGADLGKDDSRVPLKANPTNANGTLPEEQDLLKPFISLDEGKLSSKPCPAGPAQPCLPLGADWLAPYANGKLVGAAEFYELVGRPDYAESYRTRTAWRTGLRSGGMAVGLVGAGIASLSLGAFAGAQDSSYCDKEGSWTYNPALCHNTSSLAAYGIVTGGAMAGVGLVAAIIWASLDPQPISREEARLLANEYNRGETARHPATTNQTPVVVPGLVPLPGGGGLQLSGKF